MQTNSKSTLLLSNPKIQQNTSETERASHKAFSFASPPFKLSPNSNIASLLSQITARKAIPSQKPILHTMNSERKGKSGYMYLKSNHSKEPFIKEIDKCIEYFENKEDTFIARKEDASSQGKKSFSKGSLEMRIDDSDLKTNFSTSIRCDKKQNHHKSPAIQKENLMPDRHYIRGKTSNSVHERGEKNQQQFNGDFTENYIKKREKALMNEINCHRAKEKEYVAMISTLENKLKNLKSIISKRKAKAKEAKCAFLKEQILKENAIGLLKNILEK